MKQISLKVQSREQTGSGACGRLRKEGKIPAIVYGPSGSRNVTVEEVELRKLMRALHGTSALVELTDEKGVKILTVLQELSRHSVHDHFIHVDFQEIALDKEMSVRIHTHITGECIGVKDESGTIEIQAHEVTVRCLPKNLPELIEVDVTELHAGEAIHIKDLKPIEGVVFTDDADVVVVACTTEIKAEPEAEAESESEAEAEPATA